jgi:hypothetical protein
MKGKRKGEERDKREYREIKRERGEGSKNMKGTRELEKEKGSMRTEEERVKSMPMKSQIVMIKIELFRARKKGINKEAIQQSRKSNRKIA